MSETRDGGPAFPTSDGTVSDGEKVVEYTSASSGMSLRDWFAGQAITGLLASDATNGRAWIGCANDAYAMADAMLAVRAKTEG